MISLQPVQQLRETTVDLDYAKIMAIYRAKMHGYTWQGSGEKSDSSGLIVCYDINCPYCAAEFTDTIYDMIKERSMTVTMVPHFSTQLGSSILDYALMGFALNYLPIGRHPDEVLEMFKEIFEKKISSMRVTTQDLISIISSRYTKLTGKPLLLEDFIKYLNEETMNATVVTTYTVVANIIKNGSPAQLPGFNPFMFSADSYMQPCNTLVKSLTGSDYVVGVPLNIFYDFEKMKAILVPGRQDKISLLKYRSRLYEQQKETAIVKPESSTAEPKPEQK